MISLVLLGLWPLVSGCDPTVRGEASPTPDRMLPVSCVQVTAESGYRVQREYTGQLKPRRSSELSFERTGRVTEVLVDEGEAVAADQVLARLDDRELRAQRQRLVAEAEAAQAGLDEMRAGPREEQIAAARAAVAEAEAERQRTRLRRDRIERLRGTQAASEDELEAAQYADQAAIARLQGAQQRLKELEAGTRKEQIQQQVARIAALKAQIQAVDVALDQSAIRAPFPGRIARRYLDDGAMINPLSPVLQLMEVAAVEAVIGVPPEAGAGHAVGDRFVLHIGRHTRPAELLARLPRLDQATRTETWRLRVLPHETPEDRDAPPLVAGQIARLPLERFVEQPGFWLPITALVRAERGLWACYTLQAPDPATHPDADPEALQAIRAEIELLHSEQDRVFVRGMIQHGDRVIAAGVNRIAQGQLVRLADPDANPLTPATQPAP